MKQVTFQLIMAASLAILTTPAIAVPFFLGGQSGFDGTFPAEAVLELDSLVDGNLDGGIDHVITVTGNIRILSQATTPSFTDTYDGLISPTGTGVNTIQLEIVEMTNVVVTSATLASGSLVLGDRNADNADSGIVGGEPISLHSTGGAFESGDGSQGTGFLNVFLEVDVTSPSVINPLFPGLGPPTFPIGQLHNTSPLNLQATIDEYLPFGVPFALTNAPVPMFTRADHPLAVLFGGTPQQLASFVGGQITIFGSNESGDAVPEPSTLTLAALGFLALTGRRRRK